jgi:hypothetical protein
VPAHGVSVIGVQPDSAHAAIAEVCHVCMYVCMYVCVVKVHASKFNFNL